MGDAANNDQPPGPTAPSVLTPSEILQVRFRAAERQHDVMTAHGRAAGEAAVKNGEEAIKAALFINGGSCVAMLTFIGAVSARDGFTVEQVQSITAPLSWFGCGVAAALIGSAFGYFTNLSIANTASRMDRTYDHPFVLENDRSRKAGRIGEVCRWLAIAFVAISIGSFIGGLVVAKKGFQTLSLPAARKADAPK